MFRLESRLDLLRVLIVGPADTPYADVTFMFDIQLPAAYPDEPPKVHFHSTSSERLNPNLYEDGKVCLSLLGTWSGPGWIPGTSTILQVGRRRHRVGVAWAWQGEIPSTKQRDP